MFLIVTSFVLMSVSTQLGIILASGVVGAVTDRSVRYLLDRYEIRTSRKFWKPWFNEDSIIISATTENRHPGRTRGTGPFDSRALQEVTSHLAGISSPNQTPSSLTEQHPGNWRDKNIIALGGPVNNDIAEQALNPNRNLGIEFYFDTEKNRVVSNEYVVHDPPDPTPQEAMEDFGIISRLPHPYSGDEVLLIAGCWGQGTLGGVKMLIQNLDEIWQRTDGEFFQVTYRVEFDGKSQLIDGEIYWDHLRTIEPRAPEDDWRLEPDRSPEGYEDEVTVVIPCRNEAETVGNVVNTFQTHPPVSEVIVVDNDSKDGTGATAEQAGASVVKEPQVGKGRAVLAGLDAADTELVFLIDGYIENPSESWLYEAIERHEQGADIVRADPDYYPPLVRQCVKPLLRRFFPSIVDADQPLGGIVLLSRSYRTHLTDYTGWEFDIGLTLLAAKRGLSYAEFDAGSLIHGERPEPEIVTMAESILNTIIDEAEMNRGD
jgi:glucosyl-3-phosphoglycerate synthase